MGERAARVIMWTPRREMNRRSTDCLSRSLSPSRARAGGHADQHKKRWMDGNVRSSWNEVCGRRDGRTDGHVADQGRRCCNKVFTPPHSLTRSLTEPFPFLRLQVCFPFRAGQQQQCRRGGGAIYQNVSPLVSANGRPSLPHAAAAVTTHAGRPSGRRPAGGSQN